MCLMTGDWCLLNTCINIWLWTWFDLLDLWLVDPGTFFPSFSSSTMVWCTGHPWGWGSPGDIEAPYDDDLPGFDSVVYVGGVNEKSKATGSSCLRAPSS